MSTPLDIIQKIICCIDDKKGFDIEALDVREISSIADYVVIASGNVERHVIALSRAVKDLMKSQGEQAFHIEGQEYGDWIVLDFFQIVIHLFLPGIRKKYSLEELWACAPSLNHSHVLVESGL